MELTEITTKEQKQNGCLNSWIAVFENTKKQKNEECPCQYKGRFCNTCE